MWIDFLVAAVLLIFIFRGDRRGLISTLLGVVGWAAAFIAAFLFYPAGAAFLDRYTDLRSGIETRVIQYIKERAISELSGLSENSQLPDSVKAAMRNSSNSAIDQQAANIASPVVNTIMNVIAVILVMLVVGIILKIAITIIRNMLKKNRVVSTADSIGGMILGIVEGAILSYLILICLYYMSLFLDVSVLSSQLDHSIVMGFMEKYNMIPYADSINNINSLIR